MLLSDKPINSLNDDKLNRKSFSKQLAKAIVSYTSQENFTIGLCGKWGSGKTSIINMVIEEIKCLTYNDTNKPIIVNFNPWNYSDKSQLIRQFFNAIMSETKGNPSNKALKKVGSALEKYSDVFEYSQYIPLIGKYLKPVNGLLKGIGKGATEFAKQKECLENIKLEVIDALKNQKQKIIVIIDDIDRLNNEQIRLIFQLVNCVAGFPNMIYLLSFDKSVVMRALEKEQKCNGEEYLEKIIQVPFDVPDAKKEDIHKVLFDQLDVLWFDEIPCNEFEKDYWQEVYSNCLSPFINTIRDVNRIMNVYRLKYGLLHSETNCVDLLAITTLQVCAPEIFEWVKENTNRLIGSSYALGISGIDQKKNRDVFLKEFKEITENSESMLKVLQVLFPKFSWNTGGYRYSSETEDELRYKQKISCADRTQLYFRLSLEEVSISKELIVNSINNYDSAELDEMFNSLIKKDFILQYAKELNARASIIPDNRKTLVLQKLVHLQTKSFDSGKKGVLNVSPAYYFEICAWNILKTMGTEDVNTVLKKLIDTANSDELDILVGMIVKIEISFGRIGNSSNSDYRVLNDEQLTNLEDFVLKHIKEMAQTRFLFKSKTPWNPYSFWKYKDPESLKCHISKGLNSMINIPYYLANRASFCAGGKTHGWNFNKETIEEYIPIDKAYSDLISLKNTEIFSNLELDIKEIALAFYLWYNSDRKQHNFISKEEVDLIMPEWESK